MFQPLEPRRLFTVDIIGQQYVIDLPEQADNSIVITQESNNVRVTIDGIKQPTRGAQFFNVIVVHGGPGKDNIFIDASVNKGCEVYGDAGNDTIECLSSLNCTLSGGSGNDEVTFEHGPDALAVWISPDNIANDGIVGRPGVYDIRSNFETFRGGAWHDKINISMIASGTVYGGEGDDTITSAQKGDALGEKGNDLFLATDSLGSNSYFGGAGKDSVTYVGRTANLTLSLDATKNDGATGENDYIHSDVEEVVGGLGNDTLTGNQSDNVLSGFGGNDSIIGNAGNDSLFGSFGKDTLIGGLGADKIDGGSSVDLVSYVDRTKDLTIDLTGNLKSGEINENDSLTNCEKAIGGTGDDHFYGTDADNLFSGFGGNDWFYDSKGNDIYIGGSGKDTVSYLKRNVAGVNVSLDSISNDGPAGETDNVSSDVERVEGSKGNDLLMGNSKDNVLLGRQGNDTLQGLGGDDQLDDADNSDGADVYEGGSGTDTIGAYVSTESDVTINAADNLPNDGPAGENDNVHSDIEILQGGLGNDTMTSGLSGTWFYGNKGDDLFVGSVSDDRFFGGDGIDTVDYSTRSENLVLSIDADTDSGATGEQDRIDTTIERLISGSGNDTISGSDNADYIEAGAGNDIINGNAGADTLRGGDGKDTLIGGTGKDKLYGDGNNDKFDSKDGEKDTLKGGSGTDSILQKDNNDVLESVP